MTSFRQQPCAWDLIVGCDVTGAGNCTALNNLSPAMQTVIKNAATAYLWNITGRQFGTCPVSIRPCKKDCYGQYFSTYKGYAWSNTNLPFYGDGSVGWGSVVNPALLGGQWYNLPCGGCNNDVCSCTYVPTIDLLGPVACVVEVRQNGDVLDPSAYRIDNYRYLVRTDGHDWPTCQDMVADPETDDNTLLVTYKIGVEVPDGGKLAAGVLACEMAKAACGDSSCQLPQRIHSVTRQQVNIVALDSYDSFYLNGTTGIFAIDSWVNSVNYSRHRAGTRITSPDRYDRRRTTWQP
jgi:hypothetical protein